MAKGEWRYLINQMLVCTKKNFKKAVKLSRYHDAQLLAAMNANPGDLDYALVYNRYHDLHQKLEDAYAAWGNSGGQQESGTLNVKQLLKLKTTKLNAVFNIVEQFYLPDSVRFKAIFPDLRKPFSGARSSIISAFNTLSLNIGADVNLGAALTIVDDYHKELSKANTSQTGSKGSVKNASDALEKARVGAMTGQYQDLGFFINKMPTATAAIKSLFDSETITDPAQVIWKGHLDALELHQVFIHTFMAGDIMRVKSIGSASVTVYLASTPGGTDSKGVVIDALKELKFDVALFAVADYNANRYLTIVNNSTTTETRFMVQLY
ncbi:MAG: hypothetical protein WCG93_16220 [Paludibacter sp.]